MGSEDPRVFITASKMRKFNVTSSASPSNLLSSPSGESRPVGAVDEGTDGDRRHAEDKWTDGQPS